MGQGHQEVQGQLAEKSATVTGLCRDNPHTVSRAKVTPPPQVSGIGKGLEKRDKTESQAPMLNFKLVGNKSIIIVNKQIHK